MSLGLLLLVLGIVIAVLVERPLGVLLIVVGVVLLILEGTGWRPWRGP